MNGMRTTPVEVGTSPYNWNTPYKYQCTWYAYYRCGEKGLSYPCWWDRATQTGSYTDAKNWLANYRDPWVPMDKDYIPVENDIVVFDGPLGHVAFIEKVNGDMAILSQYKSGDPNSFSNYSWKIGTSYTGPLLGYLHCPVPIIETVDRNPNVNQIQTTDDQLRIRTKPNLDGEIVGHVQIGYYNVLSKKEATSADIVKEKDLKCWYEIAKNRWCANITVNYLPTNDSDIVKQITEYFNKLTGQITVLTEEKDAYEEGIKQMVDIGTKLLK